MFGCVACYVGGRLVAVLADRQDPWRGLLLPTDRVHHASILTEVRELKIHPVLGKWLYLPHGAERFESVAREIVRRIADGDPRFGVEPEVRALPRRRRS